MLLRWDILVKMLNKISKKYKKEWVNYKNNSQNINKNHNIKLINVHIKKKVHIKHIKKEVSLIKVYLLNNNLTDITQKKEHQNKNHKNKVYLNKNSNITHLKDNQKIIKIQE